MISKERMFENKDFRAQPVAEQSNLGDYQSNVGNQQKGGDNMEKNVLSNASVLKDAALAIFEWVVFVCSYSFLELSWIFPLQAIARVLP